MMRFFLHGWGSSAKAFARPWFEAGLPSTEDNCFLEGLEHDTLTGRRRWFPFSGIDATLARHLRRRAADVEVLIARELRVRGLRSDEPVGLVGHSQGGMLSLQLALRASLHVARVETFACFLPDPDAAEAVPAAAWTSVVLHGSLADVYAPPHKLDATFERLRQLGLQRVERRMVVEPDHGFSSAWLAATPAWEHDDV